MIWSASCHMVLSLSKTIRIDNLLSCCMWENLRVRDWFYFLCLRFGIDYVPAALGLPDSSYTIQQ